MQGIMERAGKAGSSLEDKALLSVKEMCSYLSIGQTKCRELLAGKEFGQGITQRKDGRYQAYICNKVHREGNDPQDIADYSGTFSSPYHNESILPRYRGYACI